MSHPSTPQPRRGEIWFLKFHIDPPDKGLRPVVVVSINGRNVSEKAMTVLIVPLTTAVHRVAPTHVLLSAGETGLAHDSIAKAENISVVFKGSLVRPRTQLRQVSNARICELMRAVGEAAGCYF